MTALDLVNLCKDEATLEGRSGGTCPPGPVCPAFSHSSPGERNSYVSVETNKFSESKPSQESQSCQGAQRTHGSCNCLSTCVRQTEAGQEEQKTYLKTSQMKSWHTADSTRLFSGKWLKPKTKEHPHPAVSCAERDPTYHSQLQPASLPGNLKLHPSRTPDSNSALFCLRIQII